MIEHRQPKHVWRNGARCYETPAGVLPGVTTIISATKTAEDRAGVEAWKQRVGPEEAERVRKAAIERGNRLHASIEAHLDDPFVAPGDAEPTGLNPWFDSVIPFLRRIEEAVLVESAVWHTRAGYAGTIDLLARIRGRLVLVDWKSSARPKSKRFIGDYQMQVAAYAAALRWMSASEEPSLAAIVVALEDVPAQVFWLDLEALKSAWGRFAPRCAAYRIGK